MRSRGLIGVLAVAMATGGIVVGLSGPAAAAGTLTVVNCNDSGTGSLRDAVVAANSSSGDTIQFALQQSCSLITLTSGAINIAASMTISGPGANALAVSGGGHSQVFTVSSGATVSISGLTIEDGHAGSGAGFTSSANVRSSGLTEVGHTEVGHAGIGTGFPFPISSFSGRPLIGNGPNGGGGGSGAGIYNQGTLTVSDSTLSGNTAGAGGSGGLGGILIGNGGNAGNGGNGGGIYNGGILTVSDSTISGNAAGAGAGGGSASILGAGGNGGNGGDGGGIYNAGSLTVSGDTVGGNAGGTGGSGGSGGLISGNAGNAGSGGSGGIYNGGIFTASRDTVTGNTGGAGGGGGSTRAFINGIAGNGGAGGSGGMDNAGALTVSNSTVAGNTAGAGGTGGAASGVFSHGGNGGNGGNGGGVYNQTQNLTIANATLSGNIAGSPGTRGSGGPSGTAGAPGTSGTGGGIYNLGAADLTGDILADSPTANCSGAAPTDGGYNVADDTSCAFGGSGEGVTDAQIELSSLQANGGPTQSEAIAASSVAATIEATGCPSIDQRGISRPSTDCSAGAYEVNVRPTKTTLSLSSPSALYGSENKETISGTVVGQSANGNPEGTVNVVSGTTTLCANAGLTAGSSGVATYKCTLSATQLAVGTYDNVEATYVPGTPSSSNAGTTYTASTSATPRTLTVNSNVLSTTTSLTLSSPSAVFGSENTVLISGTVVGTVGDGQPKGTVTVISGTTTLCDGASLTAGAPGAANYQCRLSATQLPVGTYDDVEATYQPGTPSSGSPVWTYTASTSPAGVTLVVNAAQQATTTSLTLSAQFVPFGAENTETISGTVVGVSGDGQPEGTVSVVSGTTTLCSDVTLTPADADSATYTCTLSATQLPVGTYDDVEATYDPATPSSSSPGTTYTTSTSPSGTTLNVVPGQS